MAETRTRHRGLRVDPERFDFQLTSKALTGADLALLANVPAGTISQLRHGRRVDRDSLLRVVDALEAAPTHPGLARLTRVEAGA
ncbi:MAG TPA: hypothetical protein VIP52_03290 [Candidatus Dormibacteraeota bacterium]